ncbi:hypothetical protein B0H14DRAFT_3147657 [Mycena olivaceomarginata]|nr:hypothetical protein B0H14DRAFT_3147657 [Mycena olivaceomarginata]
MGNCLSQPDPPTTSAHPHKSDVLVASSNSDPNENLAATRWNTPSTFFLKSPGHNTLLHTIITVSEKAGSNIGCKPGINPRTGRGIRKRGIKTGSDGRAFNWKRTMGRGFPTLQRRRDWCRRRSSGERGVNRVENFAKEGWEVVMVVPLRSSSIRGLMSMDGEARKLEMIRAADSGIWSVGVYRRIALQSPNGDARTGSLKEWT